MDIFNPSICLSKELKNSWATNLIFEESPDKVPVELIQGVPRLRLVHDTRSSEGWFAAALPMDSSWAAVDICDFTELKFMYFSDLPYGGLVRVEDGQGIESKDYKLEGSQFIAGEESLISIPLDEDFLGEVNAEQVKLVKFIGYEAAAFYISELRLE